MTSAPVSRLSDEQKRDWLRLYRSENIGPATFRQLINRFGSAAAALDALPTLSRRGGLGRSIEIYAEDSAKREMDQAAELGLTMVVAGEPGYPNALAFADGAPPFLYAKGRLAACERRIVAIVGARKASAVGRKMAADIAAGLGAAGVVVASGLARGIDGAAHAASLNTGTIAVLAGGHGRLYPPEHAELAQAICKNGAILSEMPPDYTARGRDFPRRNRIVSGISLAVVVIEAARRSGSLITARLAGEQGRDLLAVPGSPLDPRAEGTNALIRDGATLVRDAADVLEALDHTAQGRLFEDEPLDGGYGTGPISETEQGYPPDLPQQVYGLLSTTPISIDDLARECAAPLQAVQLVLLELELAGRISRTGTSMVSVRV